MHYNCSDFNYVIRCVEVAARELSGPDASITTVAQHQQPTQTTPPCSTEAVSSTQHHTAHLEQAKEQNCQDMPSYQNPFSSLMMNKIG